MIFYKWYEIPHGWKSNALIISLFQPVVQKLSRSYQCDISQIRGIITLYINREQEKRKEIENKAGFFGAGLDVLVERGNTIDQLHFVAGPFRSYPKSFFQRNPSIRYLPFFGLLSINKTTDGTEVKIIAKAPISFIVYTVCFIFLFVMTECEISFEFGMFVLFFVVLIGGFFLIARQAFQKQVQRIFTFIEDELNKAD